MSFCAIGMPLRVTTAWTFRTPPGPRDGWKRRRAHRMRWSLPGRTEGPAGHRRPWTEPASVRAMPLARSTSRTEVPLGTA